MIATFQITGMSACAVNSSYELRIPTTIPETPMRTTTGKRIRESVVARSSRSPRPKSRMIRGASSIRRAVTAPRTISTSQKSVEATRQARSRWSFSRSSLKTGTKAELNAVSAARARTRFGSWKATVNALISPSTPKVRRATISRRSPSTRETPVMPAKRAVEKASRRPIGPARVDGSDSLTRRG